MRAESRVFAFKIIFSASSSLALIAPFKFWGTTLKSTIKETTKTRMEQPLSVEILPHFLTFVHPQLFDNL